MRNTVKALWWLLASVGVMCGDNNDNKITKDKVKKGSGDPYWCGPNLEKVCYEGDSKEDKGWNVDDNNKNKPHQENHQKATEKHTTAAKKHTTTAKPPSSTTSKARSENPACSLDFDSGPCFSSKPMYYYRKQSKKCEMFVYGGCGGNNNRFETKRACEEQCAKR